MSEHGVHYVIYCFWCRVLYALPVDNVKCGENKSPAIAFYNETVWDTISITHWDYVVLYNPSKHIIREILYEPRINFSTICLKIILLKLEVLINLVVLEFSSNNTNIQDKSYLSQILILQGLWVAQAAVTKRWP